MTRTTDSEGANIPLVRDYVGNFIYEDGVLKMILVDNGYYDVSDKKYYFYVKDHLGNNRIVMDLAGSVLQSNQYYPFGMSFDDDLNPEKQPYKYNNKELDTQNNLNWYDSQARFYDAAIPRTPTPDPLAEKYYSLSPYSWVANNPMNAVDLGGDSIWFTIKDNIATMHVTAKVINMSSDNINVSRAATDIGKGIANAFNGEVSIDGKTYELQTNVQISTVTSMDDVASSDHLFVIADQKSLVFGATSMEGGKTITVSKNHFRNNNFISNLLNNNTHTAVHEFGHALGLRHFDSANTIGGNTSNNLMIQGGTGSTIYKSQRNDIYSNWRNGKLNQWTNFGIRNGRKVPNPHIYDPVDKKKYHINNVGLYWK